MTLTALNLVSIAVAVALTCALVIAFARLRRIERDVEGAIAVVDAPDEGILDAASASTADQWDVR